MTTKIEECRVIDLPKFTDVRGSLTPIESERNIPFAVKCVFYLYGVPAGENRAGHAHQELHEFLIEPSLVVSITSSTMDRILNTFILTVLHKASISRR